MSFRINDADKQFRTHNPELLAEGKYKEWFYQGLGKDQLSFLRAPSPKEEAPPADNFLVNFRNTQVRGWQKKSACAGADPGVFFVGEGQSPKVAYAKPDAPWRKLCPQCPVRETCLEAARESESVGIWGGKLRLQRKSSSSFSVIDEFDDNNIGTPRKRGRPRKQTWEEMQKEINDRISDATARESLVTEQLPALW